MPQPAGMAQLQMLLLAEQLLADHPMPAPLFSGHRCWVRTRGLCYSRCRTCSGPPLISRPGSRSDHNHAPSPTGQHHDHRGSALAATHGDPRGAVIAAPLPLVLLASCSCLIFCKEPFVFTATNNEALKCCPCHAKIMITRGSII